MTDAEKRLREAIECVGPFACKHGDHEFLQADIAALLDEVTRLREENGVLTDGVQSLGLYAQQSQGTIGMLLREITKLRGENSSKVSP